MMQLPDDDEQFLSELGLPWNLHPDGDSAGFLVVDQFCVSGGGLGPSPIQLMIRIPAQYPLSKLDMWYCSPAVRHQSTGAFPPQADVHETFLGISWQRFSRHLNDGCWKPGIDGLRTFFRFILRELQGKDGHK
ncbi:MAG: hypothetical protein KJZ62_07935 [Fimbriimonadaceae bacterium]|nr:hypothetical protein [Fimbriimonadaceae bacterium]QOJ10602.1 MAG: hypothetical protein HRU74_00485 [Chthonomonadaceae bacterium]